MKKMAALLLTVLLSLCCVFAQAEQMHPADRQRILPGLPEGMVASCSVSAGRVDIVIDTYATDWDKVASSARKSGSLTIHPGIVKPEGMNEAAAQTDYYRRSGMTQEQTEDEIAQLLLRWGNGKGTDYSCSTQGWAIGRYDEGTGLFLPEEIPEASGAGFAVRWRKRNGSSYVSYTERVRITVTYTSIIPIYTRRQNVGKADIAANVRADGKSLPASSFAGVKIQDGRIVYSLKDVQEGSEVYTAVAAPAWLKTDAGWKAYLIREGRETELPIQSGAAYGLANKCVVISQKIESKPVIAKDDWAIKWVDVQGKTHSVSYLEAQFHVDEPKLTIAYEDNVEPMPRGAIAWKTENAMAGLGVSYNEREGIFRLTIDENRLPENGKTDLAKPNVSVEVTAPQGAAHCTVYSLNGDVIYGDTGEAMMRLGTLSVTPGEPVAVPELTECIYFRKITATLKNAKTMNYYVSPSMVGEYGGTTIVFEWLDSEGESIGKKQYIALMTDSYQLVEHENPALTGEPGDPVKMPAVHTNEGGLYVATAQLPQMGDHVLRYEIELVDENGSKTSAEEPVRVYLPYPDGRTMEECHYDSFVVYHQLQDGSYETYSTENGKLTLTPQGLYMEVTSFSPYFLNWEEGTAPDTAQLPQTGDPHSIAAYALLLAACAVCMRAVIWKRVNRREG